MWTIIPLCTIVALFIYGLHHNDKDTRELASIGCGIAFCVLLLTWGCSFALAVILGFVAAIVIVCILDQQEEKSNTSTATSRSTSALITMDNSQVAALADEVVKVCNDMFDAGLGMALYSIPSCNYSGFVTFCVYTSGKISDVHIFMHGVGNPQKAYGQYNYSAVSEQERNKMDHYDWFIREYQPHFEQDKYSNQYHYRARTRIPLKRKSDVEALTVILCDEIKKRCPLAVGGKDPNTISGGSYYTQDVAH